MAPTNHAYADSTSRGCLWPLATGATRSRRFRSLHCVCGGRSHGGESAAVSPRHSFIIPSLCYGGRSHGGESAAVSPRHSFIIPSLCYGGRSHGGESAAVSPRHHTAYPPSDDEFASTKYLLLAYLTYLLTPQPTTHATTSLLGPSVLEASHGEPSAAGSGVRSARYEVRGEEARGTRHEVEGRRVEVCQPQCPREPRHALLSRSRLAGARRSTRAGRSPCRSTSWQ